MTLKMTLKNRDVTLVLSAPSSLFEKNRLLVTFSFKMVAIKRNLVAKKKLGSEGDSMTYYTKG